ncbi:hypothetical protein HELRODRAFT_182248 [Helobdella robusta]|uniref:Uncharacterized protein n=1 Tax=Helobdella robusta TaxID=6412 RepID=T1FHZ8_HELRO|nr:hypothetical protein HELRODRAFT_182248 [Helobdella robusta]ESN91093.1 hypothetical protein HELRODRAFT_182248 [Helobdella robusta]
MNKNQLNVKWMNDLKDKQTFTNSTETTKHSENQGADGLLISTINRDDENDTAIVTKTVMTTKQPSQKRWYMLWIISKKNTNYTAMNAKKAHRLKHNHTLCINTHSGNLSHNIQQMHILLDALTFNKQFLWLPHANDKLPAKRVGRIFDE